MQYLVVVRPFGAFRIGDLVSDEHTIQDILASEHATHVVRVTPPGEG